MYQSKKYSNQQWYPWGNIMLSNAKVDMVTNTFSDYNIKDVKARRAINSKNPESTTTEVLVSSSNQI